MQAPLRLSIGNDIAHVPRIAAWLRRHESQRCFERLFTRLECPTLFTRFNLARQRSKLTVNHQYPKSATEFWHTVDIRPFAISARQNSEGHPDARSPLGQLSHFVAGRWAAKEAVIKALGSRRLSRLEISILASSQRPDPSNRQQTNESKVAAFIDPPTDTILMDERVAKLRGLKGFSDDCKLHNKGTTHIEQGNVYYMRRAKVCESAIERLEISISHDGDYATAVCIALHKPSSLDSKKRSIDAGDGPPLHEPDWGDEGWFDAQDRR